MEHFKIIRHKEVSFNGTKVTEAMFSGNGTAKGISVTSTGNGLIIPRSAGVIYVKGRLLLLLPQLQMTDKLERQLILLRQ
jgi:hypothetical protein